MSSKTAGPGQSDDLPALQLNDLSVVFGGLRAVKGVSLTVGRGQRWAIIGPNGAGKTTLFRAICGEVKPAGGRVELLGEDVTGLPPYRLAHRGLGRTYQVTNLFAGLTVEENVAIAALGRRRSRFRCWWPVTYRGDLGGRIRKVLSQVGLAGAQKRIVSELSHGEQRQLEVALALASDPHVLLLDEPAAGLAASERQTMAEVIGSLADDIAILIIEHDMDLVLRLVERVACLHNGSTVAQGTPDEIRSNEEVQAVYLRSD